MLLQFTLFVKYILRADFSAVANIDMTEFQTNKEALKMNCDQKFGVAVLCGFILCMFLPKILPADWAITTTLGALGLSGSLALADCVLVAYRKKDGSHYMTLQNAAKAITWDVIWLLIATQPIAHAFNAEECGIMKSVMAVIMPVLTHLNPTIFVLICILVLGTVTQFVHNMVLMVVFYPILCPLYLQMGGNPWVMFVGLLVAMNAAFATPAASWNSAMMFGAPGTITSKLYTQGLTHFVLSIILFFLIVYPLASILMPWTY